MNDPQDKVAIGKVRYFAWHPWPFLMSSFACCFLAALDLLVGTGDGYWLFMLVHKSAQQELDLASGDVRPWCFCWTLHAKWASANQIWSCWCVSMPWWCDVKASHEHTSWAGENHRDLEFPYLSCSHAGLLDVAVAICDHVHREPLGSMLWVWQFGDGWGHNDLLIPDRRHLTIPKVALALPFPDGGRLLRKTLALRLSKGFWP